MELSSPLLLQSEPGLLGSLGEMCSEIGLRMKGKSEEVEVAMIHRRWENVYPAEFLGEEWVCGHDVEGSAVLMVLVAVVAPCYQYVDGVLDVPGSEVACQVDGPRSNLLLA